MDDAPGKVGRLFCWKLAISRTGRETAVSTSQGVVAQLSWLDSNRDVLKFCVQPVGDFCMGLTIRRRGRILLDRPLRADCVSNWCLPKLWPPGRKPVHVVDLDRDGEPEVIVDLQRDGAHGRRYSLVYRYLPLSGRYRKALHSWGEPDYRLRDPDHDRRPEFVSADDRFGAAFTSFAGSYYPSGVCT